MNIIQQYQRHESLIQTTKWMYLRDSMLSEKGQHKRVYQMFPYDYVNLKTCKGLLDF